MGYLTSFLVLFACCLAFPFLAKVPFLLRVLRKKEKIDGKSFFLAYGINAAFSLLFSLLVFLFLLFFNPPLWYRALFLYGTLAGLLSALRIGERIFGFIRAHRVEKKAGIRVFGVLGLTLAALLADALFFNRAALRSNVDEISVSPLSSYVVERKGFRVKDDTFIANSTKSSFVVEGLPKEAQYATFDFAPTNSQISLDIAIPTKNGGWNTVQTYSLNANHPEYCQVQLVEKSDTFLFTFNLETTRDYNERNYVLKGIRFGAPIAYNYSLGRGLLFLLVCAFAYKIPSLAAKNEGPARKTGYWKLGLAGGFLLCFLTVLIIGVSMPKGASALFAEYPLSKSSYEQYDIFVKLFDAFRKGQLHLDYEPDPKLVALGDMAYVPAARSEVGAKVLWDHAFYGGKYYSYFGAAPVIFISFPVHWITGLAPTGFFLAWVGFFAALFGFAYLAIVLMETWKKRISPLSLFFIVLSLSAAGLFFNLVVFRRTDFLYRVPFTVGLANAILFSAFTLEAYRGFHRRTFLGLAGFFFVLIMGTRPDFGVWLLFLAPLYISMLFRKEKAIAERLFDFVPMAAILALGAGILVSYNLARYGSPLEFGQSYQMTSYDMRTFKLGLGDIRGALYHFFLQTPDSRDAYPYIATRFTHMPFDTHPYRNGTIGLLYSPLPYFWLLLIPCFIKERRLELRFAYVLMPIAVMTIAWSVYGLAGSCFRYMLAIYPLSAFIALFALLRFFSFEWSPSVKKIACFATLGGCTLCFLFGANMVAAPFDGMRGEDLFGIIYYGIRDVLGAYNTL